MTKGGAEVFDRLSLMDPVLTKFLRSGAVWLMVKTLAVSVKLRLKARRSDTGVAGVLTEVVIFGADGRESWTPQVCLCGLVVVTLWFLSVDLSSADVESSLLQHNLESTHAVEYKFFTRRCHRLIVFWD